MFSRYHTLGKKPEEGGKEPASGWKEMELGPQPRGLRDKASFCVLFGPDTRPV